MAVVLDLLNRDTRPRHPEKAHRPDQPVQQRKPDWIRVKAPGSAKWAETNRINDYVHGGPGNPRAFLSGTYFWTWNTQEVLDLMRDGLPTEEIAARLFISPGTVRTHVSAILRKLHVQTREDALKLLER